jgi:hypothetical protein
LGQRKGLLEYKRLLYERGLARLEPVVCKPLDELGFQTTPPEVSPISQLDIHRWTVGRSIPGVLEVRGSNWQLTGEVVSEFIGKLEVNPRSLGLRPTQSSRGLCWALRQLSKVALGRGKHGDQTACSGRLSARDEQCGAPSIGPLQKRTLSGWPRSVKSRPARRLQSSLRTGGR